jgi:hypothetical protein
VSIRQLLRETVCGYSPQGEIVDLLYNQHKQTLPPHEELD